MDNAAAAQSRGPTLPISQTSAEINETRAREVIDTFDSIWTRIKSDEQGIWLDGNKNKRKNKVSSSLY